MAQLLIADSFFPSVAQLGPQEQSGIIEFIGKFQRDPAHPSLSLERVDRARSNDLWSGRVSRDVRAILHKDGDTWAILYADHHDAAYDWAARRSVGRHPATGALQIVESVETIREVEKTIVVAVAPSLPPIFERHDDAYLLSLGVPADWLPTLRKLRDEDQLLSVCGRLPDMLAERLLDVAAGRIVTPPPPVRSDEPVAQSPDTRRRFFVVEDLNGLRAALDAPLERWIAFLHPSQQALVETDHRGPVKVTGAAGTGKTVVAMHRARHLAREGQRVFLTSFVTTLCQNLDRNLRLLCSPDERSRITVTTVHKQALDVVRMADPQARPATADEVDALLREHLARVDLDVEDAFARAEWENVIRRQGIVSWPEYRAARRTGRGRPLSVRERKSLWSAFGGVLDALARRGAWDWSALCRQAEDLLASGRVASGFDAVVVDEVQDLKVPELRFLRALCRNDARALMLVGDAGQRIYPGGFSLRALGIEVRGRSHVLRINYRTTEQIRAFADRLLGESVDDLDEGRERRDGTRSLLRGPRPVLHGYGNAAEEVAAAVSQVRAWLDDGLRAEAIAVFARTSRQLDRLQEGLEQAGVGCHRLAKEEPPTGSCVQLGTMHRAKGLEFKVVLVADCGVDTLPHPKALSGLVDPQDHEDAVERERRLLYVAMTRARDELRVMWHGAPSPFLASLPAATQDDANDPARNRACPIEVTR